MSSSSDNSLPRLPRLGLPNLGLGVGLRSSHFGYLLREQPAVDWLEVLSENYLDSQGRPRAVVRALAEHYPLVLHGVSLSIGSTDPLNFGYLEKLRALAAETEARWVSDHLCWTGVMGRNSHDLLPLPLTETCLAHVAARVHAVQEFLGRPIVLENPSSYITFAQSTLGEAEFLATLSQQTGCGLLLDLNNVLVSCINHGWDPVEYLDTIPADRVVQMHLAGHTKLATHLLDTHDGPVIDPVWQLFAYATQKTGAVSTLLEWDAKIPEFPVVHAEVLRAKAMIEQYLNQSADSIRASCREYATREASEPQSLAIPHPSTLATAEVE